MKDVWVDCWTFALVVGCEVGRPLFRITAGVMLEAS